MSKKSKSFENPILKKRRNSKKKVPLYANQRESLENAIAFSKQRKKGSL